MAADLAHTLCAVPAARPVKVVPDCQPLVGVVVEVDVVIAYSLDCPVAVLRVTGLTVMELDVGVPFTVGTVAMAEPSPLATAPADIVPLTGTFVAAPLTLELRMLAGRVMFVEPDAAVVGVPVMVKVTTVLLVRVVDDTESPAGKFDTEKWELVIEEL